MTFLANGLSVLTGRLLIPWGGVWSAVLDVDAPAALPDGPVAIASTDGASAIGWLDAEQSGKFGERVTAAVLGGRGGWRKPVPAQHFKSPAGVPLALVVSATAAAVLEVATVASPAVLGERYVRAAGPASSVLEGRAWHVKLDGTTFVGPRVQLPAPPDVTVLGFDVETGVASLSSDGFVEPGMMLVDEQFGGVKIVRDVEIIIEANAMRTMATLVDSAPEADAHLRLADELGALARAAVRPEWCRVYEYTVIAHDGSDAVELKCDDDGPMPDILPCPIWAGVPGTKAMLAPGSRVVVAYAGGNPEKPMVVGYEAQGEGVPLNLALDASIGMTLCTGEGSGVPIALAPAVLAFAQALQAGVQGVASAAGPGNVTGAHMGALVAAIAAAIGALTAPGALMSLKVRAT